MKIIDHESGISTVASGADSNYPVTNLDDDLPQKQWKYSATSATLTVTPGTSSSLSTVALHNIEAASITITEYGGSPQALTIYTSPHSWQKSVWHEFANPSDSAFVLTFTEDGITNKCGCGVLKYGDRVEMPNLAYGMAEGYIDPSIVKEMSDGTLDVIRERDKVRTFSGSVTVDRDASNYYNFMNNIARTLGYKPASWMVTDLGGTYWHVFARFAIPAQSSHAYVDHSVFDIDIIEVL